MELARETAAVLGSSFMTCLRKRSFNGLQTDFEGRDDMQASHGLVRGEVEVDTVNHVGARVTKPFKGAFASTKPPGREMWIERFQDSLPQKGCWFGWHRQPP